MLSLIHSFQRNNSSKAKQNSLECLSDRDVISTFSFKVKYQRDKLRLNSPNSDALPGPVGLDALHSSAHFSAQLKGCYNS